MWNHGDRADNTEPVNIADNTELDRPIVGLSRRRVLLQTCVWHWGTGHLTKYFLDCLFMLFQWHIGGAHAVSHLYARLASPDMGGNCRVYISVLVLSRFLWYQDGVGRSGASTLSMQHENHTGCSMDYLITAMHSTWSTTLFRSCSWGMSPESLMIPIVL